jgi:hypothetical protein
MDVSIGLRILFWVYKFEIIMTDQSYFLFKI